MRWPLALSCSAPFRHVCDLCLCACLVTVVVSVMPVVLASGHSQPSVLLTATYHSNIIWVASVIAAEVILKLHEAYGYHSIKIEIIRN